MYQIISRLIFALIVVAFPVIGFTFTLMSVNEFFGSTFSFKKGWLYITAYGVAGLLYIIISSHRETVKEKDTKIAKLESENKEQRETLKDHSKSMWKELSKVNIHAHNESVLEVFERFLMTQENVIAVELYSYYLQDGHDNVIVKINHSLGVVMENKDHNTILQNYYPIPKYLYEEFKAAQYMFQNNYFAEEYNGHKPLFTDKQPLVSFFNKVKDELSKIKKPKDKEEVVRFALLVLAAGDLDDWLQRINYGKEIELLDDGEKVQDLFEKSKTGILRGILDDSTLYSFNYKKKDSISKKENRLYITKKSSVRGKPSIFVITVENRPGINEKKIMDSLIRLLEIEQSIEVEYNNK